MSEQPKNIKLSEEEIKKLMAQAPAGSIVKFHVQGEETPPPTTPPAENNADRPLTPEEMQKILPPGAAEGIVITSYTTTGQPSAQTPDGNIIKFHIQDGAPPSPTTSPTENSADKPLTPEEMQKILPPGGAEGAVITSYTATGQPPGIIIPAQATNLADIELRSEEVQEILAKVPNWMIRWGSALFLGLIFMILIISWFAKYPDVIPSQTYLTTLLPPQKEYAKTTGKIDTLFVKDNQVVEPQTPLAILENTANYQDVFLLKSIIDTLSMRNDSFSFPINSLPVLFLGEIDADFALFENNYLQYTLNKQLQPFSNEALANRFSIIELQNRLKSLESQKQLSEAELSFKNKELERYRTLLNKGVISEQEYESKQLDYLQTDKNLKNMSVSVSQIREAISNANKTSKGTEINRVKEEMNLLKGVIQSFNQLKRSLKDWELRYLMKSELKGKVSFMNTWSAKQTVNTGDWVFTIIPSENSSYVAKLKTPAQNSGKIKPGQTVHIRLENYPDKEFGILKGKVANISLVPDKDGFYLIDVSLPEKLITTYGKEIIFKQEMRGAAEIVTEDLRLIERFFYQLAEIFKR
jgi:multidrug efflux pump subunit AcrA (membrane-fusion protein)